MTDRIKHNKLENKLVVYDGNCGLCSRLAIVLKKKKIIPSDKLEAYENLTEELRNKIDPKRFTREMAVIDTGSGSTLYGLEAVMHTFSIKFPFLSRIRKNSFLFRILLFLYRNIAFNRYIIFRPLSLLKCDCEPPLNKFYRITYFITLAGFAVLVSSLLGISLGKHVGINNTESIYNALLITGSGWAVQILLAFILLKQESFYNYLGHLATIMAVGASVMLPGLLLIRVPANIYFVILVLSTIISSSIMFHMHYWRALFLKKHLLWTMSWFLLVYTGAIFWILVFYIW